MVVVTVARKPLSAGNVAGNVLEHGCGAINVDACRVGTGDGQGRWPANLVLGHLDGCEQVGTREVHSSGAGKRGGQTVLGLMNDDGWRPRETTDRRPWLSGNSIETVAAWNCAPGCPVAELDEQAGHLVSGKPTGTKHGVGDEVLGGFNGRLGGVPVTGYGDAGGASRFFRQVRR